MRKFCLIGHPLGHSLSPQIHTRLFELSSEKVDYSLQDIAPEELNAKHDFLNGFDGFNITIPHKMTIIDYCDELSAEAKRYNSVNCVKNGDKKVGYNTDCIGFTKSIDLLGAKLNSDVLLIGCGGVGRMIAIETALEGGRLSIAVLQSDLPLVEKVIEEIHEQNPDAHVRVVIIGENGLTAESLHNEKFDLLINSTPVGMFPKVDACPVDEKVVAGSNAAFDVIYNPQETVFIKYAKKAGIKYSGGLSMLVWQAAVAQEIWNGVKFTNDDIERVIEITQKELEKNG